jgi:glycosyltransferase involved in cell wall biosynthesis
LNHDFVVMYAGAHGISNDLGVLLDAADRLRGEREIKIVLIGDGREKSTLMQMATERGMENILFLPAIPKIEMPGALASADLCLAILKPTEAFKLTYPNKVFDYMAAGKPILLAIDGVIRELVKRARAGIFVNPGDPEGLADAIVSASLDRERLSRMGANGRRFVREHFDRRSQIDDLLLAFEGTGK